MGFLNQQRGRESAARNPRPRQPKRTMDLGLVKDFVHDHLCRSGLSPSEPLPCSRNGGPRARCRGQPPPDQPGTPHLDRMALEKRKLTSFYATANL